MSRAREEQGFVLVTAIILLTVMLGVGIALVALANSQQSAGAREQRSEAAFNLAEAALNAQIEQLSREWPGTGTASSTSEKLKTVCTSSMSFSSSNYCPEPTVLEKAYPNTGSTSCSGNEAWGSPLTNKWDTYVREDVKGSSYFTSTEEIKANDYDGGVANTPSGTPWKKLWVRAVGVVNCQTATVVSLVSEQLTHTKFPEGAVISNWFKTGNKGNKIIIKRKGKSAQQSGKFSIRCSGLSESECEQYEREGKKTGQIEPELTTEEQKPSSGPSTTLSAEQLESLKSQAKSEGHFFAPPNCPSNGAGIEALAGRPVYVEGCEGLKLTGGTANSETEPGFLVLDNGSIDLGGGAIYYGVVYDANSQNSSETLVTVRGGAKIVGEIIVDGSGGVSLGDKGGKGETESVAFEYSSAGAEKFETVTGVAATRNSFRILPSGQ